MKRKMKLTYDRVAKLRPEQNRAYEVRDGMQGRYGSGLLVRVQPTGTKSLYASYTVIGEKHPRRTHLGRWPGKAIEEARAEAQKLVADARGGIDPEPERATKQKSDVPTIQQAMEEYLDYGTTNARQYRARVREDILPRWGGVKITDFDKDEYKTVLRKFVDGGRPARGRTIRDAMRGIYSYLIDDDRFDGNNPAKVPKALAEALQQVQNPNKYIRWNDDELRHAWAWALHNAHPKGTWLRISMLTGTRCDILKFLKWTDVHDEYYELRPTSKSKKTPAVLPKTPLVSAVFDDAQQHREDEFVFGEYFRKTQWRNTVLQRDRKIMVKGLQKTVETQRAALGIAPDLNDRMKGINVDKGVRARYDDHNYLPQMRDAQLLFEDWFAQLLRGA